MKTNFSQKNTLIVFLRQYLRRRISKTFKFAFGSLFVRKTRHRGLSAKKGFSGALVLKIAFFKAFILFKQKNIRCFSKYVRNTNF